MVPVGIAVLGAGDVAAHILVSSLLGFKIGESHLFSVVAVWDSDRSRAFKFASAFSLSPSICCSRGDDALTRQDVVVAAICGASPATQPNLAAKAIHAGKHVILVPGYPLAIDYAQNSTLIEALAAYPSLVCALASGFHYLPSFCRLRSELLTKLEKNKGSIRSVSISATTSPHNLFGSFDWQADSASGGGALSQLGAPLLDASLALFLYCSRHSRDDEKSDLTSVTVQGRTAQLLDDSTDFVSHSERLWPRTAEDACWLQIDLKKRQLLDGVNSPNSPDALKSRKFVQTQSVVSVEIVTSETISETLSDQNSDPELNINVLTDHSLRYKTNGRTLWSWEKAASIVSFDQSEISCSGFSEKNARKGLLLESIKNFSHLLSSELISSATSQEGLSNSGALFSVVLKRLVKSQSIVDANMALATQRLIDSIRTSLLDSSAVTLSGDEVPGNANLISWSHCL